MKSRIRIEGRYVKSNAFVRRGVVVDADVGFTWLIGRTADDLWIELYKAGFYFFVVDEGHDDLLHWENEQLKKELKKKIPVPAMTELERRARHRHGND